MSYPETPAPIEFKVTVKVNPTTVTRPFGEAIARIETYVRRAYGLTDIDTVTIRLNKAERRAYVVIHYNGPRRGDKWILRDPR